MATVAGSPNADAARKFVAFVLSQAGQAVLARHGFQKHQLPGMDAAWVPLALSLKVAGGATALNAVLGIAVGFLLARRRFAGCDLLDAVLTLRMVLLPTVLGYYLLVLICRRG